MAKPQVDATALATQLRHAYPDMVDLHGLAEGEDSRAFGFQEGGGNFVVRLNASADGFELDRMAFEQFNSAVLPVPEVTRIERFGSAAWLCVSRRVEGDTLQALPAGGSWAYAESVAQVMEAMAGLAPGGASGAGPFSPTGQGKHETWPAFVANVGSWAWAGLNNEQRSQVAEHVAAVVNMSSGLPDIRRLVHGDFGSNNILVAGGRVTGIIDWSEAMIGDPLYDLANLMFWRPWLDCMDQQCRYFETARPRQMADRDRLACYQLHLGLKVAHDALIDRDAAMFKWAMARCREIPAGR